MVSCLNGHAMHKILNQCLQPGATGFTGDAKETQHYTVNSMENNQKKKHNQQVHMFIEKKSRKKNRKTMENPYFPSFLG